MANSVELSTFDVYTTSYFLSAAQTLEEHEDVGDEACPLSGTRTCVSYDVTLKRGDTRHAIRAVLKNTQGTPVNLSGCSVSFYMAPPGRPATVSRAVDIHDTAGGEVWVVFAPGETDVSGVYRAEFQVVYGDGRRETFPNNGYINIQILSDLRGD